MTNRVRAFKVNSLAKVNTFNYREGDLFITNRSIGILMNGKIETLQTEKTDVSELVTKKELEKILAKGDKKND